MIWSDCSLVVETRNVSGSVSVMNKSMSRLVKYKDNF